ncbi:unnamed protein product [Ilex paraguariensis]|uniref:PHD-type zinc finger plants domain-containing protein n=1 Tax=Ilex paraguariensis TaxID=185542 RepID=A0ABC8RVJ9_9AQUA
MATNKGGNTAPSQPSPECCMCGDYGLSNELFRCKVCQFRSQHRYCSNLYPKAESYRVCNWCLSQKDHDPAAEKTQNSSNSSSSNKNSQDDDMKTNKKKSGSDNNHGGGIKGRKVSLKLQVNGPIKKQKSPEQSPSPSSATWRRIITRGEIEERLRRTKSEEISNGGVKKQVLRNKVRRYKLLDEVTSQ